jgi:hypothetical protein
MAEAKPLLASGFSALAKPHKGGYRFVITKRKRRPMGRPPIGERAMTSAERQRRFLARLREQLTIRLAHLKMDPARVAQWVCRDSDQMPRALYATHSTKPSPTRASHLSTIPSERNKSPRRLRTRLVQ